MIRSGVGAWGDAAGAEEDDLLVGTLDLDAVVFDVGIFLERLVNDAAIVGVHGFEFDDIAPAPDFFGAFLGAFDEEFAGLAAITADIEDDARGGFVTAMDDAVEEVLEVTESGALAADEAAWVIGFHIQHELVFDFDLLDLGVVEAQEVEHADEGFLGYQWIHGLDEVWQREISGPGV